MLTILEQDERARERITQEIDHSFFVEAAAGSGKTSSLVDRMAAMVGAGIDVSRICAITFTKAAAKEFYNRFQKKLMQYSREETDKIRRERYAEALRSIDLCFMGTIDSFSNMMLHEHPFEAGIPSETFICAESDATSAYLAEYARIKRGDYGADLLEKYERFCAVQEKPDEAFARLIGTFTARREADFVYQPPEDMDVNTPFTTWKNQLVLTLKYLLEHSEFISNVKDSQKAYTALPKSREILRSDWNDKIGAVIREMKSISLLRLGKGKNNAVLSPKEIDAPYPELFDAHENARGTLDYYYLNLTESDAYKRLKMVQYAATMDFLVSASTAISDEICRKGTMTFHDALLRLRNMLRCDAENGGRLIRHIAKRHSYYLVDEFQDTDPLQAEVVFYLTAQEPNPDWTKCMPRPGSLFIVGDPKQSIYRFRGADVASFLRVRSIFEQGAGEVLYLSRNFRSTVKMREMFNDVFPEMLQENGNVQSGYHQIPIPETDEDTVTTGVYTYHVLFNRKLVDDGEQIVSVIRQLVGNPAVRLKDGNPPSFRDIMIITHAKMRIPVIAKELSATGIPVHVEGKIVFNDCPALNAAVDLFAAAIAPTDAMSVYKALTSAAFYIPYEMIRNYSSIGGKLNAFCENEEVLSQFPSIQHALETIKKYASESYTTDSAALFQMIADDAKLFAVTGSEYLEYYCFAVELLRAEEAAGTVVTHADAAAYLRSLLTDSGEERCVSLSADDNRVHIANLHKVKGLQAPIVILADPNAKDFEPTFRMTHEPDTTECRVFKLQFRQDNITITYSETEQFSGDVDTPWNDECECMTAEKQRLLYVAATRAEKILIIGDSIKENGERHAGNPWQAFLPYAEGTAAACIPENPNEITVPDAVPNGEALYETAAEQSVLANTGVKEQTYATVRPSQMKLRPVTADEADDAPEHEPIDRNAALTGTLVHRLMECIVSGGVPDDANVLISAILREFDAEDAKYRPLLKKVLDTMMHGGYPQENGAPADLLTVLQQADEVYCEVPFCQRRGSEIIHGMIDLLYRTGDAWHIIDYKTNAERKQLAEKYAAQLDAYKNAVREIIGAAADAKIYHIDV